MPALKRDPMLMQQKNPSMPQKKSLALAPLAGAGDICIPVPQPNLHPLEIHDPIGKARSRDGHDNVPRKKHKRGRRASEEPAGKPMGLTPLTNRNVPPLGAAQQVLSPQPPDAARPHRMHGVGRKTMHVAALDVVDGIGGVVPELEVLANSPLGRRGKMAPEGLWRPGQERKEQGIELQMGSMGSPLGKFKALPNIAGQESSPPNEDEGEASQGSQHQLAGAGMEYIPPVFKPPPRGSPTRTEKTPRHSTPPEEGAGGTGEAMQGTGDGDDTLPGQCTGCHAMVTGEEGEEEESFENAYVCMFWLDPDEGGEVMGYEMQVQYNNSWVDLQMSSVEFTGPGSAEIRGLSHAVLAGHAGFRVRAVNHLGAGPWSDPSE